MTPELVERVALAICVAQGYLVTPNNIAQCKDLATAALEASGIVRAREALERAEAAMARVVEHDGGMTVAKKWADDGRPSKHDQCEHGRWMYEGCDTCADAVLDPALEAVRQALSALDRKG